MAVSLRRSLGPTTRRSVLTGVGCALAAALVGCGRSPEDDGAASAGHSGDRFFFKDAMGWVSVDPSVLTLAFLPEQISPEMREQVIANDGVYPVLPTRQPMLEVHMTVRAPALPPQVADVQPASVEDRPRARRARADDVTKLTALGVRQVSMTFWNFEEPTPVIQFDQAEDGKLYPVSAAGDVKAPPTPLDLSGLEGLLKKGGWAVGAVRGNVLYQSPGSRPEPYYVNLQFETSLG